MKGLEGKIRGDLMCVNAVTKQDWNLGGLRCIEYGAMENEKWKPSETDNYNKLYILLSVYTKKAFFYFKRIVQKKKLDI